MGSGRDRMQLTLPLLLLLLAEALCAVQGNVVFQAYHKYGGSGKGKAPMRQLRAHDTHRHHRRLAALEFPLGGDGSPTDAALYYTKITVGTPPVDFHVQVDTGSDILWVNCKGCNNCPTKSDLKLELHQYDLSASSTGKAIGCNQDFCASVFQDNPLQTCKAGMDCEYAVSYGDGSKTEGRFIRDTFTFNQVTENHQIKPMNGSIAFGCSTKQSGESISSSQAVDGIVGLGQADTSILSQLASAGQVQRIFSHCLDGKKGGGIFSIGEVVEPKVNVTSVVAKQAHYNVELDSIDVGGSTLQLSRSFFGLGPAKRAIIDSGTTLAYLPANIYKQVLDKMMERQPNLKIYLLEEQFKCFSFDGKVDEGFPVVKFVFADGLPLQVYPHDYLFEVEDEEFCIGWQSSEMKSKDGEEMTLLGDLALSDKLVVYDLENEKIGWTDYDCSSGIKVKDEGTGHSYNVSPKNLPSASTLLTANRGAPIVIFLTALAYLI